MEDMNFDQVIDIPDTPERAGARHKNGVQFGKDSTCSSAGIPRKSNLMNEKSLNPPKASLSAVPSENGHSRRLHSHPHKSVIDVDDFDLQRSTPLENSHHCKRSPLFRRAAIVNNSKPENKNSKGGQHMENWKSVRAPIPFKKPVRLEEDDDDVLDLTKQSVQDRLLDLAFSHEAPKGFSAKETREGQIASNGHSSLHLAPSTSRKSGDTFKGKEKVDVNTCNGSGSILMNGNKIDPFGGTQNKIDKQLPASHLSATSPRVFGRKRLVRNGCISPNNISSRAQKLAESLLGGSTDDGKNHTRVMDSDGPSEADLREIVSEGNDCYTAKGKRAIIHPSTSKVHDSSNNDVLNSSSVTNNEASGQRKRTANEQCHLQNLITKRKRTHGLENQGECSKVTPDEPEILVLGSSRDASSSRSSRVNNRQHEAILEPIYEIGDFSLETRNKNCQGIGSRSNEDPDPRSRQLEADEMLARELQEQLYHEEPIFGLGEIDENLAWVLQQDEEAFSAQSSENHPVAHLRNLPMLRHHPTRSSHNPSNRRGAQVRVSTTRRSELRNRFSNRPPVTISRARHRSSTVLRRGLNFQFPSGMDLDMRLDILENLEASITTASHMFQVQRDFNENDYEMLLALDEHNPQHGASARQINSLPESLVQTDNPEETCAICLESPAIGEKIRHLPCLHKFHKDCIDPWLSRKTSCPVCKSSITT